MARQPWRRTGVERDAIGEPVGERFSGTEINRKTERYPGGRSDAKKLPRRFNDIR